MKVGKPFLGFLIPFNPGYTQFLRSLLLKPKGSKVKLYTGGNAHFQTMNYAVVDLPMLSNAEQCADACMRLKAEYLYQTGQYKRLNFKTSTASPCATAVGHREKPFTAISADSMALPAPSHSAARCSPVHWQISNPVTSLSTPEMADFLVMPSSLSMSLSIRTGKSLSPRRRQYTGSRHSPHPQLRKPISLPLVQIRRQREEIPLVHYSLQSD